MDFPSFRSSIADTVWSAIPDPAAATLLALQYQLERSERWPPEVLHRAQRLQLSRLLAHALETVPYYRDTFGQARADPAHFDDPAVWAKIPVLTRRDIQSAGDLLHSTASPASQGVFHEMTTSGSTGAPVAIRGTQLTQLFWQAITIRNYLWHGFDFKGKLAAIRSLSGTQGPERREAVRWESVASTIFVTGPSAFLPINTDVARQFEWLEQEQPDYLITYPSNLAALLLYCQRENKRLPKLRSVQTISEVLSPETRELCRAVWGTEIIDTYSTQEVGYVALQCPKQEHYHVQSENLLVEVLDESGVACQPGETGRVVVTTLHNFAMPLIRYALGDFAVMGEPCSCGRGLPVLSRILGRVRNMITLPDGRQVWPSFGGQRLSSFAPIRQYQLIQKSRTGLELLLVCDRILSGEEEEKIRAHINRNVGARFALSFHYRESIPRGASGKFEDFRCELS